MKQAKSNVKRAAAQHKRLPAVSGAPGEVRLISGKWRGRKLAVLNAEGLRPTTDRVKETLFNWLMHDINGAVVLDCFAGSGSLGFEALSRHAGHCTLLERDKAASAQLLRNQHKLECNNADIVNTDSLSWLKQVPTQQYDVVFIDPPFRKELALPCCHLLEQQQWLATTALVYLETEKELDIAALPTNWRLIKEKVAGQLAYRLYQRG